MTMFLINAGGIKSFRSVNANYQSAKHICLFAINWKQLGQLMFQILNSLSNGLRRQTWRKLARTVEIVSSSHKLHLVQAIILPILISREEGGSIQGPSNLALCSSKLQYRF